MADDDHAEDGLDGHRILETTGCAAYSGFVNRLAHSPGVQPNDHLKSIKRGPTTRHHE
jgi:hypothetical protein